MSFLSIGYAIISNIGLLRQCEQDFQEVAENIFKFHKEKFPSADESQKLLNDVQKLLDSGLIPLPPESKDFAAKVLAELLNLASGSPNVAPPPAVPPAPAPAA